MTFEYPKHVSCRSGCKVAWLTYADRETADKAAVVARKEARYLETRGYDFGFQSPGMVTAKTDGTFEVCIP